MSSALVTLITLICGLFIGLALGIWISKIKSSAAGGGNEKLAQELNDVRVLLKASEDRLKAAEAKSENETKIATQLEEMKSTFNSTAMQVGTWALDAERVAAGRPRHGIDTDFKTIPNELGVLNGAVHMNKGCYRGQETVAKVFNLGNPPRRLVMLHLDGSAVVMPAMGSPVENDGVVVGFLGTVARHHELGPIALAVVKRTTPVDAVLTVGGISAAQQVIVPA